MPFFITGRHTSGFGKSNRYNFTISSKCRRSIASIVCIQYYGHVIYFIFILFSNISIVHITFFTICCFSGNTLIHRDFHIGSRPIQLIPFIVIRPILQIVRTRHRRACEGECP